MADRPILFSGPMVRAILAGRKTQTRRIVGLRDFCVSTTPGYAWEYRDRRALWNSISTARLLSMCPYGVPGDRLWVKETCRIWWDGASVGGAVVEYRADGAKVSVPGFGRIVPGVGAVDGGSLSDFMQDHVRWRPSIFMPRAASRLTLAVEEIRVERLQSITEDDARAEGCVAGLLVPVPGPLPTWDELTAVGEYARLWDSINAERGYPWASNPWVWVVRFSVVKP